MMDAFLQHEIDLGSFPSAVYAVGSSFGIEQEGALGHAVAVPLRLPAMLETIYDCASLTKPLVTTVLALQQFDLDHRIHGYSVRELLTHTSGLRAWMPLYTYDDWLAALLREGPEYERGTRVVYSDLNFILLWSAIPDFLAKARQLGGTINPPAELRPQIAATEWGQRYEVKMGGVKPLREGLIWGATHDGNSFALGDGCAGNAGLFATAREVFRMTQAWANAELLPRALVDEATRNLTPELDDGRGLGWQITPSGAWGHTGFTGTSLRVEPAFDRIMVLLTNRVHPCAAPIAMQRIRADFYRLALEDAVEIRLAAPAEGEAISDVLRIAFADYVAQYTAAAMDATVLDAERIAKRMSEGPVWVAVHRGAIVGTGAAVDRDGGVYIRGMGVLPSARGRHIGERLLRTIAHHAAGRRLFLSTTPYLHRAIALYERFGFRRTDAAPHDLFGTPLFTMEKRG